MTELYFVRHAEPNYENHNDALRELTEKGLRDRKLVTEFLSGIRVDAVLSSPYRRAYDTVSDFAEKYGFEIETARDFRERKIDSVWIEDFHAFSKKQWADFGYRHSDGESLGEVQKRNIAALSEVLEKYGGKTVVIGSHGTALSTVLNYYCKDFGFEQFERIKGLMPWIVHFSFDGKECVMIEDFNVFTGEGSVILR